MGASEHIDDLIVSLTDWCGTKFASIRRIIHEADPDIPDIIEEWKWMGTPVWSHDGIICLANAHKDKVKLISSSTTDLKAINGERLTS